MTSIRNASDQPQARRFMIRLFRRSGCCLRIDSVNRYSQAMFDPSTRSRNRDVVLAERHVEAPMTAFSMSLAQYPPRRKLCEASVPPGGHRDGTDAVIRAAVPALAIRPAARGGSTSAGTPSTPAGGPVRPRPPTPPTGRRGRRPGGRGSSPSSATRAACAARGPGPGPGRATTARSADRTPADADARETRGRNPSSCSNRRTIPAVNADARFGGRNPSRSRAAAIAFGVSPRPCSSASRADERGQYC